MAIRFDSSVRPGMLPRLPFINSFAADIPGFSRGEEPRPCLLMLINIVVRDADPRYSAVVL